MSRSSFLKGTAGFLSAFGLSSAIEQIAFGRSLLGEEMPDYDEDPYDIVLPSKVKSVIFINMAGGMSHVDTLDPRSELSPFSTVGSSIKGVQIGEPFRKTAAQMKHVSLIRSTWSEDGDHGFAQKLLNTGYRMTESAGFPDIPSWGCTVAYGKKKDFKGPYFPSVVTMGQRGGLIGRHGFLPVKFSAFHVGNLDQPVNNIRPSGGNISNERLVRREQFLDMLNDDFEKRSAAKSVAVWRHMFDSALEFMNSEQLVTFDITKESATTRRRYGDTWAGKAMLMAKRLAAAEVPVIQITIGGWDTHNNNRGKIADIMKDADPAIAALIEDLAGSGLLDQTMFFLSSEFGRTPDVGDRDGRDHFPRVWTSILGGGPIARGGVFGESDKKAQKPANGEGHHLRNVIATLYKGAGLDPEATLTTGSGRPFPLSPRNAKVIESMLT
ncbi:MAG: DUF1501 domain-containing protein [Leptospiraceae bacterium]|nr:DUF1501 domain-containing protein [Leptospiraceae bacterium]